MFLVLSTAKVLAAKRKSLVHEHGKGNKPQAAQAIDEDEEDALFEAGEFGDSNPVALQSNPVLFKPVLDDFTFNKFVFRTRGSLLLSELLASSRIRHIGSPLSASHRKCILLSETVCHIINYLLT